MFYNKFFNNKKIFSSSCNHAYKIDNENTNSCGTDKKFSPRTKAIAYPKSTSQIFSRIKEVYKLTSIYFHV